MKKLNALNLGKSLNREQMKSISGGLENVEIIDAEGYCTCGTKPKELTHCGCAAFCAGDCK